MKRKGADEDSVSDDNLWGMSVVGMADYGGWTLRDLVGQLQAWRSMLAKDTRALESVLLLAEEAKERLESPRAVRSHLAYTINEFARISADLQRLETELPRGVTTAHIDLIDKIVTRVERADRRCVVFKSDNIEKRLKDESTRPLLDRVYIDTREPLDVLLDLSNVGHRLETYIGVPQDQPWLRRVKEALPEAVAGQAVSILGVCLIAILSFALGRCTVMPTEVPRLPPATPLSSGTPAP